MIQSDCERPYYYLPFDVTLSPLYPDLCTMLSSLRHLFQTGAGMRTVICFRRLTEVSSVMLVTLLTLSKTVLSCFKHKADLTLFPRVHVTPF